MYRSVESCVQAAIKCLFMSYHTVIQHSIGQRSVFGVLTVQILADHLDVGLLSHLLSRFHPKADVASVNKDNSKAPEALPYISTEDNMPRSALLSYQYSCCNIFFYR